MFRARWLFSALVIGLVLAPPAARARTLGVDVWTDRGKDAVYEPGEPLQIKVRASDDAYLLVYDIDSEGAVHVLFPYEGGSGLVEGRRALAVPGGDSDVQLVAEEPVGQGYIVAIASRQPFNALPWYLRPYDPQAEEAGYVGQEDDDQDVDQNGRIMGDPFVAMERIRRQVLEDSNDPDAFATAYTSYYIHQPVRYPRYLCNDCHRPRYWAWWDGWDPYYTTCPQFDFRVYWGWNWGPRYWFGTVPYYCYVPRCYPCDPYDRPYYTSWNGWRQWNTLWSGHMVRYKSAPPAGYTAPTRGDWGRWQQGKPLPPGMMPAVTVRGPGGKDIRVAVGANRPGSALERGAMRPGPRPTPVGRDGEVLRPGYGRSGEGRPGYGRSGDTQRPGYGRSGETQRPGYGRSGDGQRPGYGRSGDGGRVAPREGGMRPGSGPARRSDSPDMQRPREQRGNPPREEPRSEPKAERGSHGDSRPAPAPARQAPRGDDHPRSDRGSRPGR